MSLDERPRIERLSPSVVNKIAAGEVIERPASVVKELLENAVDAEARQIEVALEKGGIELVRVTDDGCGIPEDQLGLALASHATSKIRSADDLFAVCTLGFRGEALASIAEVSSLRLRSRVAGAPGAAELSVRGGQHSEVVPCAAAPGTCMEVRQLFFNTPVRRKFLRTPQTELSHATEAFIRVALAHPECQFTLQHHQRTLYDLPAGTDWRERIAALFGRDLADALIWVESEDGPIRLAGYVANPSHSRSHSKMQYLFLNGRPVRDRSLQHALGEAYRGLLLSGRFPICFLRCDLPADQVDVNVHPTKLEVRFQDGGRIYSLLLGTLRSRFLSTDLTVRVTPSTKEAADGAPRIEPPSPAAIDPAQAEAVRQRVLNWARRGAAPPPPPLDAVMPRPEASSPRVPEAEPASRRPSALQAHNRYLVTTSEDGVEIIDQHALHERILYEQLRQKALSGALEVQRLLVPQPVDLTSTEAAAVIEHQALLAELGIQVEPFGGDTVLVSGYPALLANLDPTQLLQQVAQQLVEGQRLPERRDLLDQLLHTISCKAAIKAGDHLSPEEISALLEHRHLVHDAHHCPHGRPTTLVFTREELDRRFKRI
jgi:DNA mismatch repair protein MutL